MLVAFQGLDNYTQMGCYSLVAEMKGGENASRCTMHELINETSQQKILFRSKLASLQQCSCELLRNNVAIVTLNSREWDAGCLQNVAWVYHSDPLARYIMKIKIALHHAMRYAPLEMCPCCQAAHLLTRREKTILNLLKYNTASTLIDLGYDSHVKSISYAKRCVMEKVGITNKIGLYRFIALQA